jgi:adenylate kinase family enzyme
MKRIAIIGSSGSGKSTFANKLGEKLHRPIIHLDKEYYMSGWKKKYPIKQDWLDFQKKLVAEDEWIIDGNYRSSLALRLDRADTIIFFDFPKWLCLWRAFKRIFKQDKPFDKPDGVREKISWELIKRVVTYPTAEIYEIIGRYRHTSKIIIVKNDMDAQETFSNFLW